MSDPTSEITALTTQLANDNLALWSDEKRKDFSNTFAQRINVARYILIKTAAIVSTKALKRHFISEKHNKQLPENYNYPPNEIYDTGTNQWGYTNRTSFVGGRAITELDGIAEQRAEEIITQLPRLNDAVRVISPDTAKLIEKRDKLLTKGKELLERTKELSGELDLDDLDQNMTLTTFRYMVKTREKKRVALLNEMDEVGKEGQLLEGRINKFLYEGLPGLSDAVLKVIRDFVDRSTAFSALNRRVSEQVQFGDSEAAMEMLKTFEKDEAKISGDIKAQFDEALQQLKLAAKKGLAGKKNKQLTTGKK